MAKRERKNKSNMNEAKSYGRSYGGLIKDGVVGDMVTVKILNARKKNNPNKYE
jgi:hypothetical protein